MIYSVSLREQRPTRGALTNFVNSFSFPTAATLASQIADDEDDDAEGQQPSSQQQQPGVQAGAESDSNILGSLPQLSENDRAAIRRIQEVSGFSEIEVIQAYIACGKNEDLAADFLFTE